MKIFLIGEYKSRFWAGSATEKVQKGVLKELSAKHKVLLFNYRNYVNIQSKFLSGLQIIEEKEGKIVQGGLINIFFNLIYSSYDIIHIMIYRRYLIFLIPVLIILRKKIVFTLHDTLILQKKTYSLDYLLFIGLLKLSNLLFIYSQFDQTYLTKYVDAKKLRIIRNGTDIVENIQFNFLHEIRGRILFAGGIGNRNKGLEFLLESLKSVQSDHSVIICGQRNNSESHPNYVGEIEPIKYFELLRTVDLVVVPSYYEPFSLTALEALTNGIPLVITKECGISRYLTNYHDALIINYGDKSTLSKVVTRIITDPIVRMTLISNGYELAKKFNWKSIIEEDYLPNYGALLK